jgi:hypothetical protein
MLSKPQQCSSFHRDGWWGMPELQEQIPALQGAPARVASKAALLQEIVAAVSG